MLARAANLYVHGLISSRPEDTEPTPMTPIAAVEAVEDMGLREDVRYFRPPPDGTERKRQVSLIDEGTIWRLESQFGPLARENIKAQIIIADEVFLPDLINRVLRFEGGAELTIAMARVPCFAMDLITPGMRDAMRGNQQGALARVTATGRIAVGDQATVAPPQPLTVTAAP